MSVYPKTFDYSDVGQTVEVIKVTADTNGAKASMTANVQVNAGGETRSDNNVAVLSQSVQN